MRPYEKIDFESTFDYKLIYIFRINDRNHEGCLKIGDATIHTSKNPSSLFPNSSDLNFAAKKRIFEYTQTAGIEFELLHTELAVYTKNGQIKAFRDYQVHEVLKRSGIKNKFFDNGKNANEWFICDLATAKNAISAVKQGRSSLNGIEITHERSPIIFRPEQEQAIKKAINCFKYNNRMLWNAKMRFGKTLCALEVVKRIGFKKTIIITHRPVVNDGWYKDFDKIFYSRPEYSYGSKTEGRKLSDLLNSNDSFVYFKSIQDLRGSSAVGGKFDKNDEIFNIDWDLVIIDEAHEGTQTKLGQKVEELLIKKNTKVLDLSGTPFNLLGKFQPDTIYTWDYIMEQEAKKAWNETHFGDPNPYDDLPKMNIFTYHLEKTLPQYLDTLDKAFKFSEFFRVWTGDVSKDGDHMPLNAHVGDFVHEKDIKTFLDLLCSSNYDSNYPFSTQQYRHYFRHSLWVVPGVKEAKALAVLLRTHKVFSYFKVINVAGPGDEEIATKNALNDVREGIGANPDETRTITLSCGRLTTGVTVPEWTAVLMLAGTYSTSASQYLQTIFRVQSPANINGKVKENCYVFDFAPDRTLKMVAESVELSARATKKDEVARLSLAKFLNYCPVVAIDGSNMKEFKVSELLQELKKAYVERVQRNGFDDPHIYNNALLYQLREIDLQKFQDLKAIVGESKQTKKTQDIDINNEGYTDAEMEEEKELNSKPKKELTEEEKKRLEELKEKRKNRQSAISILRAISIRIPLLVYGINQDINSDFTIEGLTDLIDDVSWEEFMPKKVTKAMFKEFAKYYDKDIFIAASRRIRAISKAADELEPEDRIKEIANLFATFKNPDKETVLTPWRVVNMHLSQTIGGYCFYDEKFENTLDKPRYVEQDEVTNNAFNKDSKVLEINSKTGLYPLYVVYTIYKKELDESKVELNIEQKREIWDYVVRTNMFEICKTPMAKLITKRTLIGYRKGYINAHSFDDLIMQMKDKQSQLISKIKNPSFWNLKEVGEMKFNAIVGNPPYQNSTGGGQAQGTPIYDKFALFAFSLKPNYVSLIMPSRWFAGGFPSLDKFRELVCNENKIDSIFNYYVAQDLFPSVDIKGGICYFLWDMKHKGETKFVNYKHNGVISQSHRPLKEEGNDSIIRDNEALTIINKIRKLDYPSFSTIVSPLWANSTKSSFSTFHKSKERDDDIFAYVLKDTGWINKDELKKGLEYVNKWKLFVPRSIGSADVTKDKVKSIVAGPNTCASGTYIIIGPFDNENEAQNCKKYIETKFFHYLLSIMKVSQDTVKKCYSLIPLLNFNKTYNDETLFKMFNFTQEEVNYINNLVWSNLKK